MRMHTLRRVAAGAAVFAATGLSAAGAAAQMLAPPTQRPIAGAFGRPASDDGLAASFRTFEAYDDDQLGEGQGSLDPRTQKSGRYDGLDTSVTFRRKSRRITFDANGQSAMRYYRSLEDMVTTRSDLNVRLAGEYPRTRFSVMQMASYAPYFSYSTLPQLYDPQPGAVVPEGQFLTRRPALITQSFASLGQTFGRATVTLSGNSQRTDFREEAGNQLRADTASAGVLYHLNRDVGIVARYTLQRGQYDLFTASPDIQQFHSYELGIDYDHALSLTRRSTLGFATGTTAVRDSTGAPQYRLIGDARFSREIGRTWHATASFHRGAGLIAGFTHPIFADGVQVGLTGALSRRLTLWTSAGMSSGEVTDVRRHNGTYNYIGSGRLQFALSRMLALTGEYDYYQYQFDGSEGLPPGFPLHLTRQSIRVGLSLWLPLSR
jgi:hypothetical protein